MDKQLPRVAEQTKFDGQDIIMSCNFSLASSASKAPVSTWDGKLNVNPMLNRINKMKAVNFFPN